MYSSCWRFISRLVSSLGVGAAAPLSREQTCTSLLCCCRGTQNHKNARTGRRRQLPCFHFQTLRFVYCQSEGPASQLHTCSDWEESVASTPALVPP